MVVHLLHVGVVLDHDRVLEVGATAGVAAHPVEPVLGVALGAATVDADVEVGLLLAAVLAHVHALALVEVALAEYDPVEHLVELDAHLHQVLFALHLQVDDLGNVGRLQGPGVLVGGRQRGGGGDHRVLGARGGGQAAGLLAAAWRLIQLDAVRVDLSAGRRAGGRRAELGARGRGHHVVSERRLLHGQALVLLVVVLGRRLVLVHRAHLLLVRLHELAARVLLVGHRVRRRVLLGRRVLLVRVVLVVVVDGRVGHLAVGVEAGGGRGCYLLLGGPVVARQRGRHERVEVGLVGGLEARRQVPGRRVHLLRRLLLWRRKHGRHRGGHLLAGFLARRRRT